MKFQLDLEVFRGPIDLLWFLVRKHELDINEVALTKITEQYFDFIEVLAELDINAVGDFLEVASLLIEAKSKSLLPSNDEGEIELDHDPREDLVERLLIYKEYRDAANELDDLSQKWQKHRTRVADDLPPRKIDPCEQPIKEAEIWDLVSAFGRVLKENRPKKETHVYYDETPIQVYMSNICQRLVRDQQISFTDLFVPGMHKSALVGVFLAILELSRHHNVRVKQNDLHSELWIEPTEDFDGSFDMNDIDNYDGPNHPLGDPASLVD
jgi:segregation and condensation protein A